MRCSTFFAFVALTLTLFAPSAATAGPITYNIVNYADQGLQNSVLTGDPVHLSGYIITDGTTGLGIKSAGFITDFSLTFTQGSTTLMISAQDPTAFAFINGDGLDVTTSTISLHPGFASLLEFFEMVNSQDLEDIIWEQDRYLHVNLAAAGGAPLDWYTVTPTFGDPAFSPIAEAVPEPSSLTLLGIGIVGMAAFAGRRRKATA